MHIDIQLAGLGLSTVTMILVGKRKLPQVCLDEIGLGEWPAVHYLFAESQ